MNDKIRAHRALVDRMENLAVDQVISGDDDSVKYKNARAAVRASAIALHAEQAEPEFVMPTDKQIAMAMLRVDDPLAWGKLGAESGKVMIKQFVQALLEPTAARPSEPPKEEQPDDLHIAYMAGFADGKKARPAVEPDEPVGEREQFEAWAKSRDSTHGAKIVSHELGLDYPLGRLLWEAWQGCAARSTKGST